jgi:uncharacterized protein YbjT (DUF2867 family)
MRVLVVGASGGTGREVVRALLARGHEVTAMARTAERLADAPGLTRHVGDALRAPDVDAVMSGHDAVVVTLGIPENPLRVRLGLAKAPIDLRSRGTANVIDAMHRCGVRRLVVQTSYGVGSSRDQLPLKWALIFAALLRPQIDDTEVQEAAVRASGLDWTLVQPVGLVDVPTGRPTFTSREGRVQAMSVARCDVAEVIAGSVAGGDDVGATVAVSS